VGKFGRFLQWKMLEHFMTMWSILWPCGRFCGHLVYFMVLWYIFPVLVCCTKKNLATLTRMGKMQRCLRCTTAPNTSGKNINLVHLFKIREKRASTWNVWLAVVNGIMCFSVWSVIDKNEMLCAKFKEIGFKNSNLSSAQKQPADLLSDIVPARGRL
jgi:hypothetical protein